MMPLAPPPGPAFPPSLPPSSHLLCSTIHFVNMHWKCD